MEISVPYQVGKAIEIVKQSEKDHLALGKMFQSQRRTTEWDTLRQHFHTVDEFMEAVYRGHVILESPEQKVVRVYQQYSDGENQEDKLFSEGMKFVIDTLGLGISLKSPTDE